MGLRVATRAARRPRRRCRRECRFGERPADASQRRSLRESDEPARDRGRTRHLRLGEPVVAAFQVGRFFDGGATDIGFAAPATAASPGVRRASCPADVQRPGRRSRTSASAIQRRLRRAPRRVDDLLDPDPAEHRRADGVRQPVDRRRTDVGAAGLDPAAGRRSPSTWTRTGPSATTSRRARSTVTATPSSTTSAPVTSS